MRSLYARIVASIAIVCAAALLTVAAYSSHTTFIELGRIDPTGKATFFNAGGVMPIDPIRRRLERFAARNPGRIDWHAAARDSAQRANADIIILTPDLRPLAASWGAVAAGDVVPENGGVRITRRGAGITDELVFRGGIPIIVKGRQAASFFAFAHRPPPNVRLVAGWFTRALWIAVAVAMAVALLIALLLAAYIIGPVRELSAAANAMRRGELNRRVRVRTGDELGALAASFNAMAEAVEHTDALRRRMVTDVAHELRSPLTRMRALVESAQDGHRAADAILEPVYRETRNLERLVDDLRDLSLADAQQLTLDKQRVQLDSCIAEAALDVREQAAAQGVAVLIDIAAALPTVLADPLRVRQVLRNLIDNALRYTARGGHVIIGASNGGEYVECFVQDDGAGIEAAHLENIFERFYRADDSRARSTGGTGLGLAIVKEMVAAQGGSVTAESTPGEGSRFTFRLPVWQPL